MTNPTTLKIIESHHEHFDGTGYPYGLKGREIPVGARAELKKCAGTHFDPEIIEVFLEILESKRR